METEAKNSEKDTIHHQTNIKNHGDHEPQE